MSIRYKFVAALDFSTIDFKGYKDEISFFDLRNRIIEDTSLSNNYPHDYDLEFVNVKTNEVYKGDKTMIPLNIEILVKVGKNKRDRHNYGYEGPKICYYCVESGHVDDNCPVKTQQGQKK